MEAPQHTPTDTQRLIGWSEVHRLTSISRTTAWRLERKRQFPVRVSITRNRVAWRYAEIIEWLEQRPAVAV